MHPNSGACGNFNLTVKVGCMITKDAFGMELMVLEGGRARPPLVATVGIKH